MPFMAWCRTRPSRSVFCLIVLLVATCLLTGFRCAFSLAGSLFALLPVVVDKRSTSLVCGYICIHSHASLSLKCTQIYRLHQTAADKHWIKTENEKLQEKLGLSIASVMESTDTQIAFIHTLHCIKHSY